MNGADSVTDVVLKAMSRTPDPRLRELMASLVKHLHAFVRETKPSEEEFEIAVDFLVRLGQASGPKKNEVILLSDLLGVSTLVMLLNNARGVGETDSALLGPFWRAGAPVCDSGDSISRGEAQGDPLVQSEVTMKPVLPPKCLFSLPELAAADFSFLAAAARVRVSTATG